MAVLKLHYLGSQSEQEKQPRHNPCERKEFRFQGLGSSATQPQPRKFLFLEQPPDKKARFGQRETRIVPVVMNERDGLFT